MLYHIYLFLEPGYYKVELGLIKSYIKMLLIYMLLILYIYMFVLLPFVLIYFSDFESVNVHMHIRMEDLMSLLKLLLLGVLLTLILIVLSISTKLDRKYIMLISLLMSSIITPPDVISLMMLYVPLILILESSVLCYILLKD